MFNYQNRAMNDRYLVFNCQENKKPEFIDSFMTERQAIIKARESSNYFVFDFYGRKGIKK